MKPDKRFDPPEPDATDAKRLKEAWAALEDGNADKVQGRLILGHLASLTGYYNGRSLTGWLRDTGSAQGYETACVEHEARRWVFSQILPFLSQHADGR